VDRSVLELIKSPLQHLLHNAIDHGLETPEKRLAAGKPRTGLIDIIATQSGSSIRIDVSDDGAGVDVERVKDHAVSRHLLDAEEAHRMDEQQAIWLLFQPGFSTSKTVTTVSGRGIGLDIVRQSVEGMNGRIVVENRPGMGVCFSLILPVSIATSLCLLLRALDQVYALPARTVARLISIRAGQVQWMDGQLYLIHPGEEPAPAVSLTRLFGSSSDPAVLPSKTAVLLDAPERPVALLVDELYEVQELVIKELPSPFAQAPYFSGASILGMGGVILVLSVTDLIRIATHSQ
jgi:two-component system, chemotaxis family, sensor kinase CheA